MIFTQYYLDCLSQASYLVGDESSGRAVVIDPRRDIDEYVRDATDAGLTIELVLETHFHADFLSGHLELAAATGAAIGVSDVADTEFPSRKLADGERIALGDEVTLEILQTPGHTPESISIVIWDTSSEGSNEIPFGVLTGDTMFIGDVGRPDLLASIGFTREELADKLYDSLHDKLMVLPDATKVFPAHGAGSACGKNLSTETSSTIGEQRVNNYALLAPDKATFLQLVTEGQPPAPDYFVYDAILNRKAHDLLDETTPPTALSLDDIGDDVLLLDGRDPEDFACGHLRGSINVGLDGRYAEFAGSVIPTDIDIVVIVDPGRETEARNRLARIGFDRVVGYLAEPYDVMAAHPELTQKGSRLTANAFAERRDDLPDLQLLDVRAPGEFALGTIEGAELVPVGRIPHLDGYDHDKPTVVFCAGGYRSSVAASALRAQGFTDVSDIIGGYSAWTERAN